MMIGDEDREKRTAHHGHGRGGRAPENARRHKDGLSDLENRIYTTYLARLRTANRTRLRGQLWNIPLIASPVVTLIVVIVSLASPTAYDDRTEVFLVILSVFTLVASIIVSSANYAVNSERLFSAYRKLQSLSAVVERANELLRSRRRRARAALRANSQYQEILDATQNHSSADYWGVVRAQNHDKRRKKLPVKSIPLNGWVLMAGSWCLTALPVLLALMLLPLLLPATEWFLGR